MGGRVGLAPQAFALLSGGRGYYYRPPFQDLASSSKLMGEQEPWCQTSRAATLRFP